MASELGTIIVILLWLALVLVVVATLYTMLVQVCMHLDACVAILAQVPRELGQNATLTNFTHPPATIAGQCDCGHPGEAAQGAEQCYTAFLAADFGKFVVAVVA